LRSTVDSPTALCTVNTPVLRSVSTNTYVDAPGQPFDAEEQMIDDASVTPRIPFSPNPYPASKVSISVTAPVVLAVVLVVNVHVSAVVGSIFSPLSSTVISSVDLGQQYLEQ